MCHKPAVVGVINRATCDVLLTKLNDKNTHGIQK